MELRALILYYTVWAVVAIAGGGIVYHLLARRDLRRDGTAAKERSAILLRPLLQSLQERFRPLTTAEREEFKDRKAVGIRVSLWLMIPVLAVLGYWSGRQWWLAMTLAGIFFVPAFTLPISVAHTYLLRFLGYRGPIISTATGLVLGVLITLVVRQTDYTKPLAVYGAVYGLIIGLGSTSIFAPGLVADDRPRTLEEQAKADGL